MENYASATSNSSTSVLKNYKLNIRNLKNHLDTYNVNKIDVILITFVFLKTQL